MFQTLIHPSSGACDCVDELPHWSSCSQFVVCWRFGAAEAQQVVPQPTKRTPPNISRNKSSNTLRTENKTTDVVIQQHSRKLLMMDILMSETCWAHNKWNKIASDIKLVFHSSTNINAFGHIKFDCPTYQSRFFKTTKGSQKEKNFGKQCHNYPRVTKKAYRGTSMAAQLTSNCGRPSAVNLTAHIPVPKVAPAIRKPLFK